MARPHKAAPAVAALLLLVAGVRGQSAPVSSPAAPVPPAGFRAAGAPAPTCGLVSVTGTRCKISAGARETLLSVVVSKPFTTVFGPRTTASPRPSERVVRFEGNGLRSVLEATFPAEPGRPNAYATVPQVTLSVTGSNGAQRVGTASLVTNRIDSVRTSIRPRTFKYKVKLQQGDSQDDLSEFPTGRCQLLIAAPCPACLGEGEADFGDGAGCVAATPSTDACGVGEADFGTGACEAASPAADECDGGTCITDFVGTADASGTCISTGLGD